MYEIRPNSLHIFIIAFIFDREGLYLECIATLFNVNNYYERVVQLITTACL